MSAAVKRWIKVARETPWELYAEEEARGYRTLEAAPDLIRSWSEGIAALRERASIYARAGLAWLHDSPVNLWDDDDFPFYPECRMIDYPGWRDLR